MFHYFEKDVSELSPGYGKYRSRGREQSEFTYIAYYEMLSSICVFSCERFLNVIESLENGV